MALMALLIIGGAILVLAFQERLKQLVVQSFYLNVIIVGILTLAVVWALIVIRSFQVVRPDGLPMGMRIISGALVVVVALMVSTPLVYAANATYVLRGTLSSIFGGDASGAKVDAADPWKNKPRVNILLLGGDGGSDRTGIRTDSMTVASIDTHSGNTVLMSLPRSLEYFEMPPKLHSIFPNGYRPAPATGYQGLLNELFIVGEQHPEYTTPGLRKGQRGPHLLEDAIGNLVGLKLDYYVLVNLAGFKDIVNAMGGVRVHVEKQLPIGGDPDRGIPPSGYLQPGWHHLNGDKALWYGRTRHADDDFYRMDRQKCLMKDIAEQANPQKVVTHFEQLAGAAKKTISTNIPAALLPALVKLSGSVKRGADVHSLSFDPKKLPGFHVAPPKTTVMRHYAAKAIADSEHPQPTTAVAPSATPGKRPGTVHPTATPASAGGAVSLKSACG
jgi:polyisoprenyl-teichoic acid--peptidoglycan teichoic acid transferase